MVMTRSFFLGWPNFLPHSSCFNTAMCFFNIWVMALSRGGAAPSFPALL
jgi:hypothetical protein